jgi:hypothetical protein
MESPPSRQGREYDILPIGSFVFHPGRRQITSAHMFLAKVTWPHTQCVKGQEVQPYFIHRKNISESLENINNHQIQHFISNGEFVSSHFRLLLSWFLVIFKEKNLVDQ